MPKKSSGRSSHARNDLHTYILRCVSKWCNPSTVLLQLDSNFAAGPSLKHVEARCHTAGCACRLGSKQHLRKPLSFHVHHGSAKRVIILTRTPVSSPTRCWSNPCIVSQHHGVRQSYRVVLVCERAVEPILHSTAYMHLRGRKGGGHSREGRTLFVHEVCCALWWTHSMGRLEQHQRRCDRGSRADERRHSG